MPTSGQVALTLAMADAQVRTWAPNAATSPTIPSLRHLPGRTEQVVIVHYLRTTDLDRHRLFTTPQEYAAFLELQLSGANRVFREAVTETFGTRYPFARGDVRQT
jgi:hypothetical protein